MLWTLTASAFDAIASAGRCFFGDSVSIPPTSTGSYSRMSVEFRMLLHVPVRACASSRCALLLVAAIQQRTQAHKQQSSRLELLVQ